MHALLFDRRSLMLTGAALAGLGALLFAAGFVLGVTVSRERELVPPRWVEYGPLPPEAPRLQESPPPPPGSTGEASAAAVEPVGEEDEEWVPFARPGEVEELLAREIGAPEGESANIGGREGARLLPRRGAAAKRSDSRTARAETSSAPTPVRATEEPSSASDPARVRAVGVPSSASAAARVPAVGEPSSASAPEARDGSWYVQTGAFSVADNAHAAERDLASRFADRPYGPYLEEITDRRGRLLLTVRLGPFPSRDAADAVAANFEDVLVRRTTSSL